MELTTSSQTKKVIKLMTAIAVIGIMSTLCTVVASAVGAGGGAGDADTVNTYTNVMDIILTWVRRAGAAVGLFGAIILALGFKDDDASRKTAGVWTMIAGFAVYGIALGADTFHLFD